MENESPLEKARKARGKNKIKKLSKPLLYGKRKPGELLTLKAAVRSFCLDCLGGPDENGKLPIKDVKLCSARDCPLWPYRMSTTDMRSIKKELKTGKFVSDTFLEQAKDKDGEE